MVELQILIEEEDILDLRTLIERHREYTGSAVAERILDNWNREIARFAKVMPLDYKRVLNEEKRRNEARGDVAAGAA